MVTAGLGQFLPPFSKEPDSPNRDDNVEDARQGKNENVISACPEAAEGTIGSEAEWAAGRRVFEFDSL